MNIQTTLAFIITTTLGTAGMAVADKDSYAPDQWNTAPKTYLNKAEHEQYLKECGSCHFAYQPGLLPATSWELIMANLSDHFGDNAELPATETTAIRNYLLNNAAGRVNARLPNIMLKNSNTDKPVMRITESAYFIRKHDEIKPAMVKDNPQVRSFSRCDACHTRAADASYSEREIKIPGYGRWED